MISLVVRVATVAEKEEMSQDLQVPAISARISINLLHTVIKGVGIPAQECSVVARLTNQNDVASSSTLYAAVASLLVVLSALYLLVQCLS